MQSVVALQLEPRLECRAKLNPSVTPGFYTWLEIDVVLRTSKRTYELLQQRLLHENTPFESWPSHCIWGGRLNNHLYIAKRTDGFWIEGCPTRFTADEVLCLLREMHAALIDEFPSSAQTLQQAIDWVAHTK
jgi:hypothetical protein